MQTNRRGAGGGKGREKIDENREILFPFVRADLEATYVRKDTNEN